MIDAVKFKTTADSWLGTPWKHYQRIKGSGVDCVNFIVEVAVELKLIQPVPIDYYPRDWAQHNGESLLLKRLSESCLTVDSADLQVGDILTYNYGRCASHVGFYYGDGMGIHAHIRRGVSLFRLDEIGNRLHSIWRIRGDLCR